MPCTAGRKRGIPGLLVEGTRPCSCGRSPSLCMGTDCAVMLRNSSARGMIDLVSAGSGLSQCQASAQMGALKGESPFPLLKAEQQSPSHHPRLCSHILAIIGPVAAGSAQPRGAHEGQQGVQGCLGSQPHQAGLCGSVWVRGGQRGHAEMVGRREGMEHDLPLKAVPCSHLSQLRMWQQFLEAKDLLGRKTG